MILFKLNDIVEEFNNHFASIGKSSATSINDDNNNDKLLNYLKNPWSSSIIIFTIYISTRSDEFSYFFKIN